MPERTRLFTPLRIRGFEARNRVMISPMQQYAGGADGWRATITLPMSAASH